VIDIETGVANHNQEDVRDKHEPNVVGQIPLDNQHTFKPSKGSCEVSRFAFFLRCLNIVVDDFPLCQFCVVRKLEVSAFVDHCRFVELRVVDKFDFLPVPGEPFVSERVLDINVQVCPLDYIVLVT
jgi:hypothetical protein